MLHRHTSPAVAGAYTVGAVSGALASSVALLVIGGLVSPIPADVRGGLAILLVTLLLLRELGFVCFALPERRRQIPRDAFDGSPIAAAARFAAELGTGVRTYVPTSSPYAVAAVLALCMPDQLLGAGVAAAAAGIGFGLGRARIVAAQAWRRTVAVEHPQQWLSTASTLSIVVSLAVAIGSLTAI